MLLTATGLYSVFGLHLILKIDGDVFGFFHCCYCRMMKYHDEMLRVQLWFSTVTGTVLFECYKRVAINSE